MRALRIRLGWVEDELDIARGWLQAAVASPFRRHLFENVEAYLLFVGHGRTGHTLIGQLLNAHPRVLVSHELDALKYVRRGLRQQNTLFSLIYDRELWFSARDREWTGYSYKIPGSAQEDRGNLKVVGDKKGGGSSVHLREHPGLLYQLQEMLDVPIRVLHVVRHPLDVIATQSVKGGENSSLYEVIARFFEACETVSQVEEQLTSEQFSTIYLEDFVQNTQSELMRLSRFLDIQSVENWVSACSQVVYESPSKSRDRIVWPKGIEEAIHCLSDRFSFLSRYNF